MKRFPFRLAFLSLLIPPLGYVLSLTGLEAYLQRGQEKVIEGLIIQNQEALLGGRWTVREEIHRNLARYYSNSFLYNMGVRTRVVVSTMDRQVLYPTQFSFDLSGDTILAGPFFGVEEEIDYTETAADNFRILSEGLDLLVDLDIGHTSLFANAVLAFWLLLSVSVLYLGAGRSSKAFAREEAEQNARLDALARQLTRSLSTIQEAGEKEAQYKAQINALSRERDGLSRDVEGLLDEMEGLEKGLKGQQVLREETELKVLDLQEEMEQLKSKLQKLPRKKAEKEVDKLRKRFRTLYKNLSFTERSLEGLTEMPLDYQIKAEEVLKALDEDFESVSIKRKVFGKGGKSHILEVQFSYSGRLYFLRDDDAISILAIGNKNTQTKDLAYLESHRNP